MVTAQPAQSPEPGPAPFDRDLEQIDAAAGHLREAWRSLTPLGRRHTFARGLILDVAALLGSLAAEQRRIETEGESLPIERVSKQ